MSTLANRTATQPPGSERLPDHARFELLTELGRGGMGVVHRALDRLTGRVVALKHVHLSPVSGEDASTEALAIRQSFAGEFSTLCAVRHPNIVSVLEYGFDEDGSAFFTMELYEGAQTFNAALADEPFVVQFDLVAQLVRAIHYLHVRGILHRDLKPTNVLVHDGQVKILDFGVAVRRDTPLSRDERTAGTAAYMAPEVIWGGEPSVASDLYSLGMLLYETFAGGLPERQPFTKPGYLSDDELALVDERWREPLRQLLGPDPDGRPRDAADALRLLSEHAGQTLAGEPIATRESWLRTAPLVGREAELARLDAALDAAAKGTGSAWLLRGASGVGKSRLADELRTKALVRGFEVLRGQAAAHGDTPYRPWRDIVSAMMLGSEGVDERDASVVAARFGNVERLLPGPVAVPPPLEAQAAQARLHEAIVTLCRAQRHPALIILEDAHWAGSESVELAATLARRVTDMPVVLVVTARVEEPGDLGTISKHAEVIDLHHLSDRETSTLSESMAAQSLPPPLLSYVCQQSTGVPLFVLELMRELADMAGGLDQVGALGDVPTTIPSGILRLLRKRLARLPEQMLPHLQVAAVVGRTIDVELLQAIDPDLDVDQLLRAGNDGLVLDALGRQWRFRHDKLREALLDDLEPSLRRRIHREVADAILRLRPDEAGTPIRLVHHFREAGVPDEELHWATAAAEEALAAGASKEAATLFERSVELLSELAPNSLAPRARLGTLRTDPLERWLASEDTRKTLAIYEGLALAHFDGGDLSACLEQAERALAYLGITFPPNRRGWFVEAARSLVTRLVQAVVRPRLALNETQRALAERHMRLLRSLSDVALYSMDSAFFVSSVLWRINHSFPLRPNTFLYETNVYLAFALTTLGAKATGRNLVRTAVERIADQSASEAGSLRSRLAVIHIDTASWDHALEELRLAEASAVDTGDQRLRAEVHGIRAKALTYLGDFAGSKEQWERAHDIASQSTIRQVALWGRIGRADNNMRLGELETALVDYHALEREIDDLGDGPYQTEFIWFHGMFALACLRDGQAELARSHATRALERVERRDQLCYWLLEGQSAMVEVLVRHHEASGRQEDALVAARAVKQLRRLTATHPFGAPAAAYWRAELHRIKGRRHRARSGLHRALRLARKQRRPYEEAMALRSLGHLEPRGTRRAEKHRTALALFGRMGAAYEAAETEESLGDAEHR